VISRSPQIDYRNVILSEAQFGGLPVGYWPLGEVNGTIAADLMGLARGSGNDGTYEGGCTLGANGPINRSASRAVTLDGSSGDVNFGASSSLNPTAVTAEIWVNLASLSNAYNAVVSHISAGAGTFHQLFVKSSGKLAIYVNATGGTVNYDGAGAATLSTGQWYHLAFSYSSSAGLVGYVNGQVDGTAGAAGPIITDFAGLYIGNDTFTSGRRVNGSVAHLCQYNYVVSPERILYHYLAGLNGVYGGSKP
jgi:hypothetical protein